MREGWICPSCKRGVSPDVATCDHDVAGQLDLARRVLGDPREGVTGPAVDPATLWLIGAGGAVAYS